MRLVSVLVGLLLGVVLVTPAAAAPDKGLRLMTFNVNYGNPDPDAALDAIAKADVDIVLLQEITTSWKKRLAKRFAKSYPHQEFHIHTRSAGGLAVLSKHPIKSQQILPSPERGWFPAQRLVVDTAIGALQILNVHLRPAIDGGSWVKGFLTTRPMRLREIEAYWKHMARELPTIVAGDFNEDPTGLALDFLEQKQQMLRVPTAGPTTWRYRVHSPKSGWSDLLKLDIDHVVIDGSLVASEAEVIDAGASDHRPVVVTIAPK